MKYELGWQAYLGHGQDPTKSAHVDTFGGDYVEIMISDRREPDRVTRVRLDERMVRRMRGQLTKWLRTFHPTPKAEDEEEFEG